MKRIPTRTARMRILETLPPVPLFIERVTLAKQGVGVIVERYNVWIKISPISDNLLLSGIKNIDLAVDLCHGLYRKLKETHRYDNNRSN